MDDDVAEALTSHSERPESQKGPGLASLLTVVFLVVVALVPDAAVLRQKAVWATVALLAIVGVVALHGARNAHTRFRWPRLLVALTGLCVIAGTHLTLGELTSRRLAWDELGRLALYPLGAWALAVTLEGEAARRRVGTLVCLVTIPVAALAVGQHLADLLGLPFDRYQRAPSTFGNPVFLGAFLVLVLPWCLALAAFRQTRLKWLGAVATGLALPAVLATGSVGSWLALAGGLGAAVVMVLPTRRLRLRALGAGLLVVVVVALVSGDQIARERAHTLIWRDTWALVQAHPWGIGPGQFHLDFPPFASPELLAIYPPGVHVINDVHNEPLQLLAELGWPGLVLAALALFEIVRRGWAVVAARPVDDLEARSEPAAVLAGLIGTVLLSLTSPDQRFTVSATLTAFFLGWLIALDRRGDAAPRHLGPLVRLGLLAGGLAAFFAAWQTATDRPRAADLILPHQIAAADGKARVAPLDGRQLLIARRARPSTAEGQHEIGTLLLRHGHFVDAADAFRRALALAPGHAEIVRALGVAECSAGHFDAARPALEQALDTWPDDPNLGFTAAYVCWRLGDLAGAVRHADHVLEIEPDHAYARLLMEKLRE